MAVSFPQHLLDLCLNSIGGSTDGTNPSEPLLHQIFEASAASHPDVIAVDCEEDGTKWTYRELNERAEKMALYVQSVGVSNNDLVGVFLPRGGDFYVCMLAIMKAGGAYVSIDPEYPSERVKCTIEDSKSKLVITKESLVHLVEELGAVKPDFSSGGSVQLKKWTASQPEDLTRALTLEAIRGMVACDASLAPEDVHQFQTVNGLSGSSACYAIFTSGSTGRPKGVCIEHKCAVNFVLGEQRSFPTNHTDRVLQGFSTSFDASVEEIWLAFAGGATLVVGTKETMRAGPLMGQVMAEKRITVLSTVPTVLRIVEDIPAPPLMRIVITGGEACPPEVTQKWCCPGRQFLNTYGPTEATVVATFAELQANEPVTIGFPVKGYSAYIRTEAGEYVTEPGVHGELLVGGASVARGYINRADLNPEKFIHDVHTDDYVLPNWVQLALQNGGADRAIERGVQLSQDATQYYQPRLYRTGDLVQWSQKKEIEFLGRIDSQVKIRGFRVELAEIESAIARFPGIQNVAVVLRSDVGKNGAKTLVAYIEPKSEEEGKLMTPDALRDHAKSILPDYMVPARYCVLPFIPLSPTGKVDRKYLENLPAPGPETAPGSSSDAEIVPAETALEEILANLWKELLDLPDVSCVEDFFNLGGTSLTAAQFISGLRKRLPMASTSVRDIYDQRTIRKLSLQIEADAIENGVCLGLEEGQLKKEKVQEHEEPVKTVSPFCKFLCGLGQGIVLLALAASIGVWAIVGIEIVSELIQEGRPIWYILTTLPAFGFSTFVVHCFGAAFLKWLLLGEVKAGEYPLWGWFYFRFWIVQTIGNPTPLVAGTPLVPFLLRLFGTKVGSNVHIASDDINGYDLLDIGDDVVINVGSQVHCYEVEHGLLKLANVVISRGAILGMRSAVKQGSRIDDSAELGDMSVLFTGQCVPAGQKWTGAPARRVADVSAEGGSMSSEVTVSEDGSVVVGGGLGRRHCRVSNLRQTLFVVGYVFAMYVNVAILLAPLTAGIWLTLTFGFRYALMFALPYVTASILGFFLVTVILKWCTLGKVREGSNPLYGFFHLRWLMNYVIQQATVTFCHQCYSTIFTQYYLKALGAKIGKRVEFSDAREWTPDMLEIDDDCFVADFVGLGGWRVGPSRQLSLKKVKAGAKAFLGNGACVPGGSEFGKETLLGVMSLAPSPTKCVDGSSWMGSNPFSLANRAKADAKDVKGGFTYSPPAWLYSLRLFFESVKCISPPVFATYAFLAAWFCYNMVYGKIGALALYCAPLFTLAYSLSAALMALTAKWLLVGKYGSRNAPLWSTFVWRAELSAALEEDLAYASFMHYLVGTPFIPIWFRLLGAKIGRNCYIATPYFTEPDMVQVGANCCINGDVTIQGHLFEDRVMKLGPIKIGDNCSIGTRAVILYHTTMDDNSTLEFMSLMMKGEEYSKDMQFAGLPARPTAKAKPVALRNFSEASTRAPEDEDLESGITSEEEISAREDAISVKEDQISVCMDGASNADFADTVEAFLDGSEAGDMV